MFYLMTHSAHFTYGYMASDIVAPVAEHWLKRNRSMGPPSRMDPTTHGTTRERFYHEATSRSETLNICVTSSR